MTLNVKYVGAEGVFPSWVPLEIVTENDGRLTYYSGPFSRGEQIKEPGDVCRGEVHCFDHQLGPGRWLYRDRGGQVWDADYRMGPGDLNPKILNKIPL